MGTQLHCITMMAKNLSNTGVRNHVLRKLAREDPQVYDELSAGLQPVALHRGAQLAGPSEKSDSVYFIEEGVVSMVGDARNGSTVEVAVVGVEGVAGLSALLGARPVSYRLTVQIAGLAYRAPGKLIRHHLFGCRALHDPLLEHTQAMIMQLTQSVICSRFHTATERLARWLLLSAERAETRELPLTHEVLAQMVGVPRSAVTQAASSLRAAGIIEYARGQIVLRNLPRLKKKACECYELLTLEG